MADPENFVSPWRLAQELTRVYRSIAGIVRESRIPKTLNPPQGRPVEGNTTARTVALDVSAPLDDVAGLARADEDGSRYLKVWLKQDHERLRCLVGDFQLGVIDHPWSDALIAELAAAQRGGWHPWADGRFIYERDSPRHSTLAVWLP